MTASFVSTTIFPILTILGGAHSGRRCGSELDQLSWGNDGTPEWASTTKQRSWLQISAAGGHMRCPVKPSSSRTPTHSSEISRSIATRSVVRAVGCPRSFKFSCSLSFRSARFLGHNFMDIIVVLHSSEIRSSIATRSIVGPIWSPWSFGLLCSLVVRGFVSRIDGLDSGGGSETERGKTDNCKGDSHLNLSNTGYGKNIHL